jgi:brefeldin A-resistance guanine nucleotide exchange factor 1
MSFQVYIPFAEKILVSFVSLCIKLVSINERNLSLVAEAFPKLQKLHSSTVLAEPLSRKSMLGLAKFVEYFPVFLKEVEGVQVVTAYTEYSVKYPNAESVAFRLVSTLLSSNSYLTRENYQLWVSVLVNFIKSKAKNDIIIQSMELLYNIYGRIPLLHSQFYLSSSDVSNSLDIASYELTMWRELWYPILDSFVGICKDNRADVRNNSLTYLQKCLLSPQLTNISASIWYLCFEEILFPLVKNLVTLKPNTPSSNTPASKLDSNLLEETRLRASALLSKIFLQYLPKIIQLPQFNTLWIQILRFIEMYMKEDDNELLVYIYIKVCLLKCNRVKQFVSL